MPFELRPAPQPTLRPEDDYLQRAWSQSVYPLARRMGAPIQLPTVSPQPHTHLAWEGYQFAREQNLGNEYNHRVLKAFFVESQDIGQPEVLARLAADVGLDEDAFAEALRTRRYQEAHEQALRHAFQKAAVTGVPAFVIGDHLLVGLQPASQLIAALESAAARLPRPGGEPACGTEGCPPDPG